MAMESLMPELASLVEDARAGREDALVPLLAACDRVLALDPSDGSARHAKLVALIELGRYADAEPLAAAAEGSYERAYCLYQLGRGDEALALLPPEGQASEAEAVLAAQILYRDGAYREAARRFQAAAAMAEAGGSAAEHRTNLLAALVLAGDYAEAAAYAEGLPEEADSEQFELAYNVACARIGRGEFSRAKAALVRALGLCRDNLTGEEMAEEEMEVELGVLTAQAAYVDQMLGLDASAAAAYASLAAYKTELEPAVAAVVANNTVALRGESAVFDSWKKCKANLAEGLKRKLTPAQRKVFLTNAALLSVAMSKPDQANEVLATLAAEFPRSQAPAVISAALSVRAKRPAEAEATLRAAASEGDPEPILALAQMQLDAKDASAALRTLHGLRSLSSSPALVSALLSLHERIGDVDGAALVLQAALDTAGADAAGADTGGEDALDTGGGAAGGADTAGGRALLRGAASFYSRHGRWAEAAAAHRRLAAMAPRDATVLGGLVIAESYVDAEQAHERLARLELMCPPLDDEMDASIDAEALEQAALPKQAARQATKRSADAATTDAERAPKPRKKRRAKSKRIRLPKNFDPEHPERTPAPDPERWLPKHERSTYRARKKDRGRVARGPQGSTSGAARVDDRTTTNVKELTEEEKAKARAKMESAARSQAAAAAAAAAAASKKLAKNKKGKDKW